MKIEELKKLAVLLRLETIEAIHRANSGHTGGAMSAMDMLAVLYFGEINGKPVMKYDAKKPDWQEQDYFIMSKGHAAPALYAVLAEAGFFPREELKHLRQVNSLLQGHPVLKIPGVNATTGSLGQGLSVANGIALAAKLDRAKNRVYCMMGDGELQEGQIWEAAMTAAHYQLDNLIGLVDLNGLQIDGSTREVMNVEPVQDKFEAFGWKVIRVREGNDVEALLKAMEKAWKTQRQPTLILAHTVKGKCIPFAEGKVCYHGVALSPEEMAVAREELEKLIK